MDQSQSQQVDIAIIGAGPAGFTAGMYAARSDLNVLLIEGTATLSQITYADHVENYPGFPEGVSGFELNDHFRTQALRFGLKTVYGDVTRLAPITQDENITWEIHTSDAIYRAKACIIATGASWRKMGIPGEEEFVGKGVSYCATCDAPFYRNKNIAVIGGGDTAVGEAIYLTRFASKVTLIHRRDKLRACGLLQKRALSNEKIDILWDTVPESITGGDRLTTLHLKNTREPARTSSLAVDGVFILIGLTPNTAFLRDTVAMDDSGYILASPAMSTSARGLFACGDCCHKDLRQVVTACSDGAVAAFTAEAYLETLKDGGAR